MYASRSHQQIVVQHEEGCETSLLNRVRGALIKCFDKGFGAAINGERHSVLLLKSCFATAIFRTLLGGGRIREVREPGGGSGFQLSLL